MILADKIIQLRKKSGWSQEELADKMGVSRQAVSKWEGVQAVPDLNKILVLSRLFGVSTDYLLKDELEAEEYTEQDTEPGVRCVSMEEANAYLRLRIRAARQIALATFLCILSPVPLILLGAAVELPGSRLSENLAAGLGLIQLLILVAIAVALFVFTGFQNQPYEFLNKDPFEMEYGVRGMLQEKQKAFHSAYARANILATGLCVLSPVPLFAGLFSEEGTSIMEKRLYKSNENKMVEGVCGGIAEYFGIDPTLVRLGWVLFCALGGSGILAYIIAAVVIPRRPEY